MTYDSVGTLELSQLFIENLQGRFGLLLIQFIQSSVEDLFLLRTCSHKVSQLCSETCEIFDPN